MSSCNREHSPILKRQEGGLGRRQRELIIDEEKIHRIMLQTPAICKLAHIQSPNCIWFKLANHITEQLQFNRPKISEYSALLKPLLSQKIVAAATNTNEDSKEETEGAKLEDGTHSSASSPPQIQRYQYVMAPLQEDVYARGRVIRLETVLQDGGSDDETRQLLFAYIHFIDEGFGAWMNTECLAKMDRSLYTHPWQAFPVALYKLRNARIPSKNDQSDWPVELTNMLYRIMVDYRSFRVEPVLNSTRYDALTYWDYVRANIYGLEPNEQVGNESNIVASSNEEENNEKRGRRQQRQNPPAHHDESIGQRLMLEFTQKPLNYDTCLCNGAATAASSSHHTTLSSNSISNSLLKLFNRPIFDAKQQPLLREPIEELTSDMLMSIPRWRLVKPNFS